MGCLDSGLLTSQAQKKRRDRSSSTQVADQPANGLGAQPTRPVVCGPYHTARLEEGCGPCPSRILVVVAHQNAWVSADDSRTGVAAWTGENALYTPPSSADIQPSRLPRFLAFFHLHIFSPPGGFISPVVVASSSIARLPLAEFYCVIKLHCCIMRT